MSLYDLTFLDENRRAFGRKLKPLTLAHARLINGLGVDKMQVPLQDLILIAIICSLEAEQARRIIFRQGIRFRWMVLKCRRYCERKKVDPEAECLTVTEYLTEYFTAPKRWRARGEKAKGKNYMPWPYLVFVRVASLGAFKADEIWGMSLPMLTTITTALAVVEGDDKLQTLDEAENFAKMRAGEYKGTELSW